MAPQDRQQVLQEGTIQACRPIDAQQTLQAGWQASQWVCLRLAKLLPEILAF